MENGNGSENKTGQEANAQQQPKIEFNDDQQKFINELINKRFSKVEDKHQQTLKALQDEKTALENQLAELKNGKTKKETTEQDPKEKQFADLLNNEKSRTKAAEELALKTKEEAKAVAAENMSIRKEIAISKATGGRFLDMDAVMAMTASKIEYDDDSKTFVVRENGVIRQNSSLQNMTLEEYFEEFGKKRPYLVNSDVVGGAGSTENKKGGLSAVGVVNTKADLKTIKEKSDYIKKFGIDAFEKLPLR